MSKDEIIRILVDFSVKSKLSAMRFSEVADKLISLENEQIESLQTDIERQRTAATSMQLAFDSVEEENTRFSDEVERLKVERAQILAEIESKCWRETGTQDLQIEFETIQEAFEKYGVEKCQK